MLNIDGRNFFIRTIIRYNLFLIYMSYSKFTTSYAMLENQENFDQLNPFKEKIVHFDLKGAPPTLNYYEKIFPLLKKMNVDGILMEYEDMFPYWDELSVLKRTISYSKTVLETILKLASDNDLEVIPLVQTFGHMEFVLKHVKYSIYRENMQKPETICPSAQGSQHLIAEMLMQIRIMHPNSRRIHIGADEAYNIGEDIRCLNRFLVNLNFSKDHLKLDHISRTARYARDELGFEEVLAWNDMFDNIDADLLNEYQMSELVIPVIWGYAVNVTEENYFPRNLFQRYSQVFSKMMFASAFKGANGIKKSFCDIKRYLANQQSYVELYEKEKKNLDGKISGIILTGWQRYSHYSPLCETLPVSVPSLIVDLIYLNDVKLRENEIIEKDILNCRNTSAVNLLNESRSIIDSENWNNQVPLEMQFINCSFPGSEIYDEMAKFQCFNAEEEQSLVEFQKIRENVAYLLRPYFYEESIDEIVAQQLSLNTEL